MRRVAVGAMLAALFAAPTFAAISDYDTDGDNLVSFDEMVVAYPDLTEDLFAQIDTSTDGLVDEAELTTALEANLIVKPAE